MSYTPEKGNNLSQNKPSLRKVRFFTLIELLTVIVIMAMLMSIVLTLSKSDPTKQNARLIGSQISLAQAQAIQKNIHAAAIISEDAEGALQVGVYRWYFSIFAGNETYLNQTYIDSMDSDHELYNGSIHDCEWIDIQESKFNEVIEMKDADDNTIKVNRTSFKNLETAVANRYRNLATVPGTKIVKLIGHPKFSHPDVNVDINKDDPKFAIFLFKPDGTLVQSHSYASNVLDKIEVKDERGESASSITINIANFSGKISYN